MTPEDNKYAKSHEYVHMEGEVGTIGITDYAQKELGDVVFVELPQVGTQLEAGDELGSIESVKAVSELFSPVSGEVVEINGGRTILVSGQVAYDKDGKVVGKGDIRAQSKQVFENLKAALDSVGATFNDVVKLNTFMVNMPENLEGHREVRGQYLAKNEHQPASTTVGVAALVNPDLLLEVEAVVVLPSQRKE